MDERLAQLAAGLGGVFGSRDVNDLRVPPAEVAGLVRTGEVVRVRRGAFVLTSALHAPIGDVRRNGMAHERPLTEVDRYRLTARAVLRSRPRLDALSHHASAAVHGCAVHGVDLSVVDVASAVDRPTHRRGLSRHPGAGLPIDLVEGVRCVRLPEALVQVAAASGTVAGVCSMDDAVHRDLVTVAELRTVAKALPTRYRSRVLETISLIDPACESVGETRTRLILRDLGFAPVSQARLFDEAGLVGRVDFIVDDLVVVEFDGLVKYEGHDGKAALAAEKARESRITATGLEVVRVVWSDLDDPAALAARIRMAKARALRRRGSAA
jgi:hypothetical protein